MPTLVRRTHLPFIAFVCFFTTIYYLYNRYDIFFRPSYKYTPRPIDPNDKRVHWQPREDTYPVKEYIKLPRGRSAQIPKVQCEPPVETEEQKKTRLERRDAVKESFQHSWEGYKKHGWLRDEVTPLSASYRDTFGGWSATLVDALDTLWIMGYKQDFEMAVAAAATIDFTTTEAGDINVFETTIRYLGGFLAAYDISGQKYPTLLSKATEVAELLMGCFDTPNRMPITRWDWKKYMQGKPQTAPQRMLVSEIGSLTLEFTRLSQLTGEPKYYDAVQRISNIFDKSQNRTRLPGMWPVTVDAMKPDMSFDNFFTLGGMSDSLYEYFPKQYVLLGGLLAQPKKLYEDFIEIAQKNLFFRVLNPKNLQITVSGDVRMKEAGPELRHQGQHLTCFTGGMVALASRVFARNDDLKIAAELTEGCVWAYDSSPHGVAPELFVVAPCPKGGDCTWSEKAWHDAISAENSNVPDGETPDQRSARIQNLITTRRITPGFTDIPDRRYILRPEAIESVFIMYRVTGQQKWADAAWRMFQAVEKISRTDIAASALNDVTTKGKPDQSDSMESFWLAETLKYFYLCFENWNVVSLDEYVLNTEAHPLKRPR